MREYIKYLGHSHMPFNYCGKDMYMQTYIRTVACKAYL